MPGFLNQTEVSAFRILSVFPKRQKPCWPNRIYDREEELLHGALIKIILKSEWPKSEPE